MNSSRHFEFYSKDSRNPYIKQLVDFKISETDGHIHFDGYYYVLNQEFPKHIFFITTVREDISCKIIEYKMYEVEIYDRIKIANTSSYDEDSLKLQKCYFPTYEQKLLFRVIQTFDNFDIFLNTIKEYFKQG
jgi:hypothetical protein